jgi:hypothetical protein
MDSENTATTFVAEATAVAPEAGSMLVTVGGVVSAGGVELAVVKVHVRSAARALPRRP